MNKIIAGLLVFLLLGSTYLASEVVSKASMKAFDFGSNEGLLFLAAVLVGLMSIMYFGREIYARLKAAGV
ncbi:MAG: hypothetical protein V1834_01590 [Candidatus Micrarchaeota archaeon]